MSAQPQHWSVAATSTAVLARIAELDLERARVVDVGAGRGAFTHRLAERLRARGLDPAEHLSACDLVPESFEVEGLRCAPIAADGRLPFADASFDAVVSIEVVEHVEDQFAFLRELARIARPGGLVVVTTPNTAQAHSRLRELLCGFPELFDALPISSHDPRHLGGHVHPIAPYFLAYAALRAGLVEPHLSTDRIKRSAAFYALATAPLWWCGGALHRRRLARKAPRVLAENRELLAELGSWPLRTGRTAILCARKPRGARA